jgi:hypothetical protein
VTTEIVGSAQSGGGGADPMAFDHGPHKAVIIEMLNAIEQKREPSNTVRRKVAMYDFHVRLGIEAHPVNVRSNRHGDSRWRFASLTDAEKFAHQFGGSLVAGR